MSTRKITVHRLERFEQAVEVEVDAHLSDDEAAKEARRLAAEGEGTEKGTPEYHSTDQEPGNWSCYSEYGNMIG